MNSCIEKDCNKLLLVRIGFLTIFQTFITHKCVRSTCSSKCVIIVTAHKFLAPNVGLDYVKNYLYMTII